MDIIGSIDHGGTTVSPQYRHGKTLRGLDSILSTAPLLFLIIFFLIKHNLPSKFRHSAFIEWLVRPYKTFLTIQEAEERRYDSPFTPWTLATPSVRSGRTITLGILAVIEAEAWLSISVYTFPILPITGQDLDKVDYWWNAVVKFLAWTYCAYCPLRRPKLTPLYEVFIFHLTLGVLGVLHLSRYTYDTYVYRIHPLRHPLFVFATILDLTIVFGSLYITLTTHIAHPGPESGLLRKDDGSIQDSDGQLVSPEDYTTLWRWTTFAWVTPVTKQKDLSTEDDVWNLSPLMATRAIYSKYVEVGQQFYPEGKITPIQFVWHLWKCHSLDIILGFSLSTLSALSEFAQPLFLKLILDAISEFTTPNYPLSAVEVRQIRAVAVVYAVLYFVVMMFRALFDLHQQSHGRRAGTRARNQVMVWIYDKSLRRRDVVTTPSASGHKNDDEDDASKYTSGTHTRGTNENDQSKGEDDEEEEEVGADLGKVVNLMSTDAETVEGIIEGMYDIYNAFLQVIVALLFLYQLIAGVIVFIVVAPINHILSDKVVKIYENMQRARDKKMSVLNELISEIRFIKFLAYEEQWTRRALEARAKELKIILRSGYLDIAFTSVWRAVPVAISIISFWAYIWSGNTLTVSTAFTVMQVFWMLYEPLGILPMVLVRYFRVKVSVQRIAKFLSEPQVDYEISSFKNRNEGIEEELREATDTALVMDDSSTSRDRSTSSQIRDEKIGIVDGRFLWSRPFPPAEEDKQPQIPWWRRLFWRKTETDRNSAVDTSASLPNLHNLTNNGITPGPVEQEVDTSISNVIPLTSFNPIHATVATAERHFELKDINVLFPPGKLSVITGRTASGKTALLLALLGEMYTVPSFVSSDVSSSDERSKTRIHLPKRPWILDPTTRLHHCPSYAAQTPWLENISIKDNILFGSHYDEDRYQAVLECCALELDLATFEDGDETEIGERGITLSGGQKARVALARAVYAFTKYVLLDDPLSAVDSHTRHFLFDHLFTGPLLANHTVILVTHHVDMVLPKAGYLVHMTDGRIDSQGTISELCQRGILKEIIAESKKEKDRGYDAAMNEPKDGETDNETIANMHKKTKRLVEEEEIAEGQVKSSVYYSYIKSSAYITWVAIIFFSLFGGVMEVAENLWMQIWGEASQAQPGSIAFNIQPVKRFLISVYTLSTPRFSPASTIALPSAKEHPMFYVGVYALISTLSVFGDIIASAILVFGAYRASRILFQRLLTSVTRATMRWHDITPTGRILNRFSKDFETIDETIASSFSSTLSYMASLMVSIVTIVVISPTFLVPGAIIAYLYVRMSKVYLATTRPLKRLDSTTISPIHSSFRTTLEGLVTIRAFSAERRFLDTMIRNIDVTTKCYWTYWMVNQWVSVRFEWLGTCTVVVVMLIVVIFGGSFGPTIPEGVTGFVKVFGYKLNREHFNFDDQPDRVSGGFEGLAIVTAMSFTWSVYWACRFISQLELDLNAVERVDQYLDLPQEPPAIVESSRPPAYWPSVTSPSAAEKFISVENLVIKYAPHLPTVLHGVSVNIRAGERVALTGRTGSGKSTLATALFRFVDPVEGRIVLDGIDITTIGLYDLRSRVTFIPQDSVLFSGTIRRNIDPLDEHTDDACIDVLRRVHLIEQLPVSRQPASGIYQGSLDTVFETSSFDGHDYKNAGEIQLDSSVSSGGSNFSHGQRQLIGLARALLRRFTVIIMDEPTSYVDLETDPKVQAALREEFSTSCVIIIAHRIKTIIDYDRVLVMDAGRFIEDGPPRELMESKDGAFYQLCVKDGLIKEESIV